MRIACFEWQSKCFTCLHHLPRQMFSPCSPSFIKCNGTSLTLSDGELIVGSGSGEGEERGDLAGPQDDSAKLRSPNASSPASTTRLLRLVQREAMLRK